MIQRIQTVYLAIVAILSATVLFAKVGTYMVGAKMVAWFNNFAFNAEGTTVESAGPWALGVILLMVILLNIVSIMLFNFRMRQLRLTIFSTILLVGYVTTYAFFAWLYQGKLEAAGVEDVSYHLSFMALLPVVSIILNMLAIHGIRKDEALVRSLDRIR